MLSAGAFGGDFLGALQPETRFPGCKLMFTLGIHTRRQFDSLGPERRFSGFRTAYNLLDVGSNPSPDDIRVFEDVSFVLRTSNGTYRTSFRNRFTDVNLALDKWLQQLRPAAGVLRIQDRAVSHGLTATEWALHLRNTGPSLDFEASDLLLELLELTLADGTRYITEIDCTALQYISPPFVVSVFHPEIRRDIPQRLVSAWARRRFRHLNLPNGWADTSSGPGYTVRRLPCIHPEAAAMMRKGAGFRLVRRSLFDITPGACDVVRTMNILNRSYFSEEQLGVASNAIFDSLAPGGIWVLGRTLEEDFSNHVSILRREGSGWVVLDRLGSGSEIEDLAVAARRRS